MSVSNPEQMSAPVQVLGHYSLVHNIAPDATQLPDLKGQIAALCGSRIRRVDRYIELCVLGALKCVQACAPKQALPKDTAVYLASRCGAVHTPSQTMASIFQLRQSPKPLHFVNTLGNTACFYLTRSLEIDGQTQVVAQEALSFEAALFQAVLDIQTGVVTTALVGGIDEVTLPLAQQAQRLGAPETASLLEGSHWLLLSADTDRDNDEPRLARPEYFSGLDDVVTWLASQPDADVQLSFQATAAEQQTLAGANRVLLDSSAATRFNAWEHGVYSGDALLTALNGLRAHPMIHIGRSGSNYCAVLLLP